MFWSCLSVDMLGVTERADDMEVYIIEFELSVGLKNTSALVLFSMMQFCM